MVRIDFSLIFCTGSILCYVCWWQYGGKYWTRGAGNREKSRRVVGRRFFSGGGEETHLKESVVWTFSAGVDTTFDFVRDSIWCCFSRCPEFAEGRRSKFF